MDRGLNSVVSALAHGLPMVLIPMDADHPLDAARCADLGLAWVLNAVETTPQAAHDVLSTVLEDPARRQAAERTRSEMATLTRCRGPDNNQHPNLKFVAKP